MKIAHVGTGAISIPPSGYGGVELHIYRISAKMARAGHDVIVLDIKNSGADPDSEEIEGITFHRLHRTRKGGFLGSSVLAYLVTQLNIVLFAWKANLYLRGTDFHVVHVHSTLVGFLLALLNKNLMGKMVFTAHQAAWDMSSLTWLERLSLRLNHVIMQRAARVFVFTDVLRDQLVLQNGMHSEKVYVIRQGVDTQMFTPSVEPANLETKYGLRNRPIILFVGKIVPYKGVEYLTRAADILINEQGRRDAFFLLVGPYAERGLDRREHISYVTEIRNFIASRGLDAYIKLVGPAPFADLPSLFQACDFFVLPSLAESSPLVISQAIASGKPVVATEMAGIRVQVREGWNGYLVERADERQLAGKIAFLMDHPEEWERMGANSRKLAEEEFDWSRVSDNILRVYQSMGAQKNE